jgi:hypothetical protein
MSAHCYNNIRRKQVNEPPGKLKNSFHVRLLRYITGKVVYRVSQNSRIPNSERGREGPSGARKILFALLEEDISTLLLFNRFIAAFIFSDKILF